MAKVLAPLFSTKARGQIGKSLVFFPWKSINAVRSYVIPANPNTAGQQAQRTRMTNAVAEWHDAGYTAKDKTAWNKFASTLAGALSGFNAMVRSYIDAIVIADVWIRISNVEEISPGAADVDITADVPTGTIFELHYGTSPTFMPETDEQSAVAGVVTFDMSGLVIGVIYYYYIDDKVEGETGRTGVYKYKHIGH
ncbi:hypothetical protein ES703_62087 [subsurface metagenome]